MSHTLVLKESEIIGRKHGKLTVESFSHRDENKRRWWVCLCECGNRKIMSHSQFRALVSCGCKKVHKPGDRSVKHGMSHSTEYSIWHGIRKRCLCKTDQVYHRYGGRGIGMCKEWMESFAKFYEDVGPRPEGMTLDRIDNNLGYCKENCRWVDWKVQQRNRRNNHLITINGETKCLIEWAEQYGIRKDTLRRRIVIYGWEPEQAIKTPTMKKFGND